MPPSIKLPVGEISFPYKLGFSEITPPQSLLPSNVHILNLMLPRDYEGDPHSLLMLPSLFIIVFYPACNSLCVAKIKKNKTKIRTKRCC